MCIENTQIVKYSLLSLNLLCEHYRGTLSAYSKDDDFTSE